MNRILSEKNEEKESIHIPVLFAESIDALNINPKGIYVDGTLGGAGHAEAIVGKLKKSGTFIGIDVDIDAIKRAQTSGGGRFRRQT